MFTDSENVLHQASTSSMGCDDKQTSFLQWFSDSNGWLNPKCRLAKYARMGTGMLAAETIEEDEVLFSIPRSILLSLRNSILPQLCTSYDKEAASSSSFKSWQDVNVGWQGLMITLMWENFRGTTDGKQALETIIGQQEGSSTISWGPYFDILPDSFDTPMFWNQIDLEELKGTSIAEKIGKEEATEIYNGIVLPYIEAHRPIFFGNLSEIPEASKAILNQYYSLQQFHIMGSRVLSRSFHVKPKAEEDESDEKEGVQEDEMSFEQEGEADKSEDSDSDSEDEDEVDDEMVENVSMAPMADILNAAFGRDNAHLFYKTQTLEMRAIRKIETGEQIWNTYGEPPSSDLLRRYGYVDLGCPFEIVELPVQHLLEARLQFPQSPSRESLMKRIEWACALGVEEISPLQFPFPPSSNSPFKPESENVSKKEWREAALQIPEDLLVLARVLCWTEIMFSKSMAKERLPNPRIDAIEQFENNVEIGIAQLILRAIEERKKSYPTSLEEDEQLVFPSDQANAQSNLGLNRTNAIAIRVVEKRILAENEKMLQFVIEAIALKRKQDIQSSNNHNGSNKKSKRS